MLDRKISADVLFLIETACLVTIIIEDKLKKNVLSTATWAMYHLIEINETNPVKQNRHQEACPLRYTLYHIMYSIAVTEAEYKLGFELTKDTPYLAIAGNVITALHYCLNWNKCCIWNT